MSKIAKRSVSLITAIIIIMSMIPSAFDAFAANVKIQIENADGYGVSSDITIGKGYAIHKRSYWCMIHTSGSKRAVYCLEPGKDVTSGDTFSDPVTREDRRVCFYA